MTVCGAANTGSLPSRATAPTLRREGNSISGSQRAAFSYYISLELKTSFMEEPGNKDQKQPGRPHRMIKSGQNVVTDT